MKIECLKRAIKREDDGTPIGFPGTMYLDCECGHHLPLPQVKGLPISAYQCLCGLEYDANGWIVGKVEVKP